MSCGWPQKYPSKHPKQLLFEDDLCLLVGKSLKPLSIVDDLWFRRTILNQEPRVHFPDRTTFRYSLLPAFVARVNETYVFPHLNSALAVSLTFDLWMSRKGEDVFSLVAHWTDENWEYRHCNLGLVRVESTAGIDLSVVFKGILDRYNLTDRTFAYVKDDGSNLHTLARALDGIVTCKSLGITKPLQGDCLAHALSGSCGKATTVEVEKRVPGGHDGTIGMIGKAHAEFQKCVTYTKKSAVGTRLLTQAQKHEKVPVSKLYTEVKTRFTSKFKYYADILQNRPAMRYMFGSLVADKYMDRLPSADAWRTAEVVVEALRYPATICYKTQDRGHWMLGDAVHRVVALHIEFRDECSTSREQAEVGDDRFLCLKYEMMKQVLTHLDPFLLSLKQFHAEKAHMFLSLALHPRYKGLSSVVGYLENNTEVAKALRDKYDNEVLIPMCIAYKKSSTPVSETTGEVVVTETNVASSKYADLEEEDDGADSEVDPAVESVRAELARFRRLKIPDPEKVLEPYGKEDFDDDINTN
ncbi:hypothetical protein CYMTET_11389 [Cymbomonas tetramitiformis]|uniref:Uncharacterized protein n=1 Tax=Cymbomonas tetramitiformis TaxID=36881 RepID=A0AAE0LD21_9CHLO|nr:hypothetical protein CYMTET_11389 [Cymbomonas tetramitiformis]